MSHQCPYERYYLLQAGSGIGSYYKGASYQKGRGLGAILGLVRSAFPIFRAGAKALGQEALRAGLNVVRDIADSKDPRESLKRRAGEAGLGLLGRAEKKIKTMTGAGRAGLKHVRGTKRAQSKPGRRRGKVVRSKRAPTKKKRKPVRKGRKTRAKRKTPVKRLRDIFD